MTPRQNWGDIEGIWGPFRFQLDACHGVSTCALRQANSLRAKSSPSVAMSSSSSSSPQWDHPKKNISKVLPLEIFSKKKSFQKNVFGHLTSLEHPSLASLATTKPSCQNAHMLAPLVPCGDFSPKTAEGKDI